MRLSYLTRRLDDVIPCWGYLTAVTSHSDVKASSQASSRTAVVVKTIVMSDSDINSASADTRRR